ncbi:Hypothetical_protein [Hexamita inflata]|uniref:Hypothetical_protein n=1 Tax=Hexamita inflata TaxID=28002 RepID=A0ABP1J658_9EUKA
MLQTSHFKLDLRYIIRKYSLQFKLYLRTAQNKKIMFKESMRRLLNILNSVKFVKQNILIFFQQVISIELFTFKRLKMTSTKNDRHDIFFCGRLALYLQFINRLIQGSAKQKNGSSSQIFNYTRGNQQFVTPPNNLTNVSDTLKSDVQRNKNRSFQNIEQQCLEKGSIQPK